MDNNAAPESASDSFSGSPTCLVSPSDERSGRKRNVEDRDNECSVSCNLRRSRRLMNKSADHSINQHHAPAPKNRKPKSKKPGHHEEDRNHRLPRRMLLRQMLGPDKLDLSQILPYTRSELDGCAELVIQNHSLEHNQNWRDWHILDIVEATRLKDLYSVTFQAEKADDSGLVRKTTFEGHLWSGHSARLVKGIRTLKPYTKWYRGKLWIPLTRPPPQPKDFAAAYPFSRSVSEEEEKETRKFVIAMNSRILCDLPDPLVPVKSQGSDPRISYNLLPKKRARKTLDEKSKKTNEGGIITRGSDPVIVNLELGKLSDSDVAILNGCATLAMQDHLIQTRNSEFRDWKLVEIQDARREGLGGVAGYNYHLTFRARHGDDVRTLEAKVWDGMAQRRVNRFRAIMPRTTDWYPGDLWIPI